MSTATSTTTRATFTAVFIPSVVSSEDTDDEAVLASRSSDPVEVQIPRITGEKDSVERHERAIMEILLSDPTEKGIVGASLPGIEISLAHGWDEHGYSRVNIVTDSAAAMRSNMRRNPIATKIMTGPKLRNQKTTLHIYGPAIIIAEPPNLDESEDEERSAIDFTLADLDIMLAVFDGETEMSDAA